MLYIALGTKYFGAKRMLVSDFHRVRGRLLLMTVLFCMAFFVIVYRLYMWTIPSFLQKNVMNQADAGKDYSSTDDHNNAKKPVVFPVRRKDITDRHGISLATTIKTYALYIDPKKSINPQKILNKLHLLFPDLDYAQLEKKINGKSHVAIKRPITPYEAQKSHDLKSFNSCNTNTVNRYPSQNMGCYRTNRIDSVITHSMI
jgi:cell division protein FtsI/penicillin-binding protein 2